MERHGMRNLGGVRGVEHQRILKYADKKVLAGVFYIAIVEQQSREPRGTYLASRQSPHDCE